MIVARSRPEVDLVSAVGIYVLTGLPRALLNLDDSLIPCIDMEKLLGLLEIKNPT